MFVVCHTYKVWHASRCSFSLVSSLHHPFHVKRGLVRYLFDRARNVTSSQDNLQMEEIHLAKVLKQNGYPGAFIRSYCQPLQQEGPQEPSSEEGEQPPLAVLPYTAGVSENVKRVCQKFGMKVVFRSSHSLRSMLTKVKDALPMEKQANIVYRIPCSCGKAYIGETKRRLETRLKEHRDACRTQSLQKRPSTSRAPLTSTFALKKTRASGRNVCKVS